MGNAFNTMAVSFGFKSVFSVMAMVVLLVAAHGLNMVLCLGSVLIHGIRLNTLEFSMHLGMEWSGAAYVPFSRSYRDSEACVTNGLAQPSDLLNAKAMSPSV